MRAAARTFLRCGFNSDLLLLLLLREAFRSGVVLQPGPKGPELTYSAQSNMVTSGPYLHAFREKEAKSAHQHA